MNIRIKPPAALSSAEIDLGTLDFPERWLALPPRLDARPSKASMASHAIAQEGEEWCRTNAIEVNETCQYRFDRYVDSSYAALSPSCFAYAFDAVRAVWTVTIIESLLFDCDSGKVVVTFVQEAEEEEYAVIEMKVKLLLECVTFRHPTLLPALRRSFLSCRFFTAYGVSWHNTSQSLLRHKK